MKPKNEELHLKKKKSWRNGLIATVILAFMGSITFFGDFVGGLKSIYEILPFSVKFEGKTNTSEIKTIETNTNEVKAIETNTNDAEALKEKTEEVTMDKTIDTDDEKNLIELVNSETTYTYRIRVITYTSENLETYSEKVNKAQSFVDELNKLLASHEYDNYIEKDGRKIPEDAFFDKEEADKDYIYVYVNQSSGTIADMVSDVKTLNRKYEEMFKSEGWLGSNNKWEGLIIDYSDDDNMKYKKTLSTQDLYEMALLSN